MSPFSFALKASASVGHCRMHDPHAKQSGPVAFRFKMASMASDGQASIQALQEVHFECFTLILNMLIRSVSHPKRPNGQKNVHQGR